MQHSALAKLRTTPQIIAGMADALRARRVAMGLTQGELASRANVSLLTIHNLESGRSVRLDTLIDVARVLDMAYRLVDVFAPDAEDFTSLQDLEDARSARKRVRVPS